MRYEDPKIIVPSPFNKDRADEKTPEFLELVDSIRTHGIIQPLIARIRGQKTQPGAKFELIAGERRWRAATIAKLREVPIIVREADDALAVELQTIENDKRKDLSPIQKAEKYQQLLDQYGKAGISGEEGMTRLCQKIGKSKSAIYEALALIKLPDPVKVAIRKGDLPASHAGLIAKIDGDQDTQIELLKAVLNGKHWESEETPTGRKVLSFRNTKDLVDRTIKAKEGRAKWDKLADDYRKKGGTVIDQRSDYGFLQKGGYIEADEHLYDFVKSGSVKTLMGKHAPAVILAHEGANLDYKPVWLYKRAAAIAAIEKNGIKRGRERIGRSPQEKGREAAHRARMKVFLGLLGKVAASAERMDGQEIWRFILAMVVKFGGADSLHRVIKRREIKVDKRYNEDKTFTDLMAKKPAKEVRGAVVEMLFARMAPSNWSSGWDKGFEDYCKLFKVPKPDWKQKVQASGKPAGKAKKKGGKAAEIKSQASGPRKTSPRGGGKKGRKK